MFFILSKIAGFLIQPLNFALFLLVIALLARLFGRRRLSVASVVLSFLVLALAGWTSIGALMLKPLEERFHRPATLPDRIAGVVVLGGGFEGAINLARGGYELNSSGDRFVEAAILARRFPEARVVVSGGSGALILDGEKDADTAPRMLEALGVTRDRLILENQSRNTEENAIFSKALALPKPGETWLMVTSAFHMPRSVGLFRKAGFEVVPWPTDYRTSGQESIGLFQDSVTDALQNTTLAIREWVGLLAYRVTGRIDELVPGP